MPESLTPARASSPGNAEVGEGILGIWRSRSVAEPDPALTLVDRVLHGRGLTDAETRAGFCSPSMKSLHDPSLIPDLDKAAERILRAVRERERVAIFGDYDVDGVTGTAILVRTIRAMDARAEVVYHIPSRMNDGYGLNTPAIERLAAEGASLIVSVDCGITSIDQALAAKTLGVDLIITDHHTPPATVEGLPKAFAVVHPGRPDSAYPWADLCGAGVAYKLAWRLATLHAGRDRATPEMRRVLIDLLPLAAMGTIADVVPLEDENRVLARFGVERANGRSPIVGIAALMRASGIEPGEVDSGAIGYQLGPRINACGRLADANVAVEMLLTDDRAGALRIAEDLTKLNEQRRGVERRIVEAALAAADEMGMTDDRVRAVVLSHADWHPGVIGIVCSKLVERLAKPVILLCDEGETLRGSGRSVDGFDLHGALTACGDELVSFGGHPMAAGLSLEKSRLDSFRERFTSIAGDGLAGTPTKSVIRFDTSARLGELDVRTVASLKTLEPHGRSNPKPRFLVRGKLDTTPEVFGKHGDHLRLRVRGDDGSSGVMIAWRFAEYAGEFHRGMTIEAIIEPGVSTWNGNTRVDLVVRDARVLR